MNKDNENNLVTTDEVEGYKWCDDQCLYCHQNDWCDFSEVKKVNSENR